MKFIIGQDRDQIPLFASSIEAAIARGNEIRLIDMFVNSIKLAGFGFKMDLLKTARWQLYCHMVGLVGYRVAHWRNFVH